MVLVNSVVFIMYVSCILHCCGYLVDGIVCISLCFGDCGGRMVYLSDWCFAVRCVACVLVV